MLFPALLLFLAFGGSLRESFSTERQELLGHRALLDLSPGAGAAAVSHGTRVGIDELESGAVSFWLPPPFEEPVDLMGPGREVDRAARWLSDHGWRVGQRFPDASAESVARALGAEVGGAGGRPRVKSFRPNAFLQVLLESPRFDAAVAERLRALGGGVALDLGCGSGRDAVYLSQRLGATWRVVGADNHRGALDRAAALGEAAGAPVDTWCANLRGEGIADALRRRAGDGGAGLIHGCRFLDRALLHAIAAPGGGAPMLRAGGLFVWSTFMDPAGDEAPLAPPFKASRRLASGELRRLFEAGGAHETLVDEEGTLITRGEAVAASFYACVRTR